MLAGFVGGPVEAGGSASIDRAEGVLVALDGELRGLAGLAATLRLSPQTPAAKLVRAGWTAWSHDLLSHLRGPYALLIWDERLRRGVLARDRAGAVPLLWARSSGRVCFATEQRALLALLGQAPAIDEAAVVHWLAGGGIPHGRTLHEGVRRVAPGCHLRLDDHRAAVARHARLRPAERGDGDACDRLRTALAGAVAGAAAGSERVGVLLSGGLDSAIVASLAVRAAGAARVCGYSLTFPRDPRVDESQAIRVVARELGLAARGLAAEGGRPLAYAADHAAKWRVPLLSPNAFLWGPLLARARGDGVSRLIDGEGGDEVLGACPYLLADRLRGARPLGAWRLAGQLGGRRRDRRRQLDLLLTYGLRPALPPALHRRLRGLRSSMRGAPDWLRPPAAAIWRAADDRWSWKEEDGPRWAAGLVHTTVTMRDALGVAEQGRRFADEHGLALSRPLLDEEVLETMLALDPELGFDAVRDRPLARDALAGIVPEPALRRVGKAFFDPFAARVLLEDEGKTIQGLLAPGAEVEKWVDLSRVPRLDIADLARGAGTLWRLAAAEVWLRCEAGRAPLSARPSERVRGTIWTAASDAQRVYIRRPAAGIGVSTKGSRYEGE